MRLNLDAEVATSQPRPLNGGLSVLVVEDEMDTALSQALLLKSEGHSVKIVKNGPAALHEIREWNPDVVLLDLGLPGMTGHEVAQSIYDMQLRKRPFIVAVSGSDDRCRSREVGIDVHLIKPADPEQLLQILRRFQSVVAW
jgi:two-component system OmpR family response regulator